VVRVTASAPPELEQLFGDPTAPDALLNHQEILEADARRELVHAAESALTSWGFGKEFVPASLGGRWVSSEDLVRRILPVFRRDPALGLGQGVTSLMAAVNVWVAGDPRIKQRVADALIGGERIATGFHELAHGNDLLSNECEATRGPQGWTISGCKEVINNIDRAESALLFVHTGGAASARAFSLLLWSKDRTLSGAADTWQRLATTGMRGCRIGAVTFDRLVIAEDSIVGEPGAAVSTALRAFQVTRAVLPALANGALDSSLRLAIDYMRRRNLYGSTVWELPHARSLLVRAWGALLVSDSLARASVRLLHRHPDELFVASAASKYLAPALMNAGMEDLTTLFGSSFYALDTEYGIFEKWLRDLIVVPIGHAGSVACLLSLAPALPTWARRVARGGTYDRTVFDGRDELGEVKFDALGLGVGRQDSLVVALQNPAIIEAVSSDYPELTETLALWQRELAAVLSDVRELPPGELGFDLSPRAMDLARRAAALMAAGSVLGTWYEGREDPASPFAASRESLIVAMLRVTELLQHVPVTGMGSGEPERPATWPQDVCDRAARALETTVDAGLCLGTEQLPTSWKPTAVHDVKGTT
jgi:alkylation response protein AidB-like acyl-CoA dehydrogenase